MLCPPTLRPASPADSEISVGGAPSPLPHQRGTIEMLQQHHQQFLINHHAGLARGIAAEEYFQPLKRLRMSESTIRDNSASPPPAPLLSTIATQKQSSPTSVSRAPPPPPSTTVKSNIEGVKSFSIADILGHEKTPSTRQTVGPVPLLQHRSEHFDVIAGVPHTHPAAAILLPSTQIVRPWDHLLGPIPVRPFIPSALLHYEQRLALDYHRQIQEHFNAQAQLLRHMGVDIIPSESGSERSSSAASDCCSPENSAHRLSSSDTLHANVTASSQHNHHSPPSTIASQCSSVSTGSTASISAAGASTVNASSGGKTKPNGTPLDALFQMTNKDFDESQDKSHIDLFANRPQPKKKRKSRTAFTNHQIFELERRFMTQKYLAPSDRDEIAAALGLSNAQVITWFQNRRAKQKRDFEELKKDYDSVNAFSAHKSFLENVNDLSILKKKPMHDSAGLEMFGLAGPQCSVIPSTTNNNSNSVVTHTLNSPK